MSNGPARALPLSLAIGLVTCSTLIFEITLTRVFSVILWYHYGFMVISLALLGIGLSGIYVYLYPERFPRSRAPARAARASVVFAFTTVIALILFHLLMTLRTTWPPGPTELALVLLIMVVPFFFGGLAVAIPLSRYPERIGQLYGADLIGAALGAVLVIPLLTLVGGHRSVVVAACVAALAAVLYGQAQPDRRWMIGGALALLVCAGILAAAGPTDLFRIRFSKQGAEHNVIFEQWNSFSRVTVLGAPPLNRSGLAPAEEGDGGMRRHRIRIDGGAGTPLLEFDGDLDSVGFLRDDVASLGYQVRPQESVLIIGAGGGRDILAARSLGVPRVHAVEINPIIVDLVRHEFPDFARSPYDLPGVTWSVADGRNYLATSRERFDHIQLSKVDTIAASAAGALALVEQSLYTVEAFLEYFDHLTDDGLVSITRPFNTERIEVTLRMVDLVRAAWQERGVTDPGRHLVVIGPRPDSGAVWGSLLASRRPFRDEEIQALTRRVRELGCEPLYIPGASGNIASIDMLLGSDRASFLADYPESVAATTDDRPFFFYFRKPWDAVREALWSEDRETTRRARAAPDVLVTLLLFVTVLSLTTAFAVPLALGRLRLRAARGAGGPLIYFAGIGLGFMLVEIAFLQRFTLLLGQPIYAFAVILGSMLVFSGLGSFLTQRAAGDGLRRLARLALAAVLAGIAAHAVLMPGVVAIVMHWSLPLRLGLTVLAIAPVALAMGLALPTGMRLMERTAPQALAWAWGVNGTLSVLGATIGMTMSVFFGITATLVLGFVAYGIALLTPWRPLLGDGTGPAPSV